MNNFCKRICTSAIVIPFLMSVCCLAIGSAMGVSWTKSDVVPVVIVEPSIGGFKPMEGSSIGNKWSKSQVKPVLLVKPGIGGFVPLKGGSISNKWKKKDVLPVMLVESSIRGFAPLHLIASRDGSIDGTLKTTPTTSSVIESKVDGDFEGWEGETIIKLMNGQIWQQTEYHYHYHYAFMPEVLIFKSDGGYKMRVNGIEKSVRVKQLSVIESKIDGAFEGWEGDTIVKLMNGQIWQQTEYHYHYHYAFMPEVLIFKSGSRYKMRVTGVKKAVSVGRLK